jgi:hypothetical protein
LADMWIIIYTKIWGKNNYCVFFNDRSKFQRRRKKLFVLLIVFWDLSNFWSLKYIWVLPTIFDGKMQKNINLFDQRCSKKLVKRALLMITVHRQSREVLMLSTIYEIFWNKKPQSEWSWIQFEFFEILE